MNSSSGEERTAGPGPLAWSLKLYANNFALLCQLSFFGGIISLLNNIRQAAKMEVGLGFEILLFLLSLSLSVLFYLALVQVLVDARDGAARRTFTRAVGEGAKKFWPNLGIFCIFIVAATLPLFFLSVLDKAIKMPSLLVGLVLLVLKAGTIFFNLYAFMALTFVPYVLVIRGSKWSEALGISLRLACKHFWRIWGGMLLLLALIIVILLPGVAVLMLLRAHGAMIVASCGCIAILGMPVAAGYFLRLFTTFSRAEPVGQS